MRDWVGKRYWIVGASAGLGREVAKQVSATGAVVILSARNEDDLRSLADECAGRAEVVPIDVADDASVAEAYNAVGHVDGIIFLAGVYWPQSAREWDREQVNMMLDVNLTGAVRVLGHVVPSMVERDDGHIVITGSLSGFRGLPGAIGYGASKAGIMSLAESMYMDLRTTGVQVQLLNPGFIRTRLTDKNTHSMPFIMEPDVAAREFIEQMQGDSFSRSYPTLFASFFRFTQFLPNFIYYRLFG